MVDRSYYARWTAVAVLFLSLAASATAQRPEKTEKQSKSTGQDSAHPENSPEPATAADPESAQRPHGEGRRGRDGRRSAADDAAVHSSQESSPFGGREFRGGPGGPLFRPFEPPGEATSKQGYLFVNGEYLSPPYQIRLVDNALTVNGQPLECRPPLRGFGRSFGPRPSDSSWRYMLSEVLTQLTSDLVVLCFKDQPYVVLDSSGSYDLLKTMTTERGRAVRQLSVRELLPEEFDKTVWDEWIERFDPPGELLHRAAVLINSFEATQRQAESDMRATKLMNRLAYPLAVSGMVLSVLAIGHLLGGRPHARQRLIGRDESPEMIHSLNWSLLFVSAFSILDLTWTILAANAGQMQELNPIGSHLVENPGHLAGFKVGITLPSLALIWLLRKQKRAQAAAWWLCLILTFVTLRWLMISPLMAPV
jgi:hypothetical protein